MSRAGKGISIRTPITWRGETKTPVEWAEEIGVHPNTLVKRLNQHKQGHIATLDDCFKPVENRARGNLAATGRGIGKRVESVKVLFDAFAKWGWPRIDDEMRVYMESGGETIGPALTFYSRYQSFFPKDKLESLDGEAPKELAQVAIVINSNVPQPQDITIIDQ